MSNPTTPFSWQMPTNTDLVTDLPADFEVFGQAVATSMADLLGGTTGQVLSKTTNADMDFTWVAANPGDITAVGVTSPINGGGTSGAVTIGIDDATTTVKGAVQLSDSTSTTSSVLAATPTAVKSAYDLANGAIAKTTLTTAGDVIYRNATVPTRLGIGTAGQVLTVNSGATAPQWSTPASGGGMTLINTGGTALTGASVTVGSIPSTYQSLYISVVNFKPATNNSYLNVRMNGDSTANRHYYAISNVAQGSFNQTRCEISYGQNSGGTYANIIAQIPNYADGTIWKSLTAYSLEQDATTITNFDLYSWYGAYNQITAISSLDFLCNTGNFTSGTVYVYGVK